MKKNVSGQVIGAQMVSATDGSAFSGSVTCYVTGDGGTQAAGSVSSGACTHEGNGFHTYAPAQAETNYDHVAFTFTGSGAIPATVQVYTSFPQTGDSYARLGAPAGASVSADVAAVKAKTDNLPADPADASDIASAFSTVNSTLSTIAGYIDTEVAAIKAKTDNLPASPAATSDIPTAVENADALLGRNVSGGSSSGRLVKEALHFLRNKWVVSGGTLTVYDTDDSTSSWTATVTGTAGADPVTGSDPA